MDPPVHGLGQAHVNDGCVGPGRCAVMDLITGQGGFRVGEPGEFRLSGRRWWRGFRNGGGNLVGIVALNPGAIVGGGGKVIGLTGGETVDFSLDPAIDHRRQAHVNYICVISARCSVIDLVTGQGGLGVGQPAESDLGCEQGRGECTQAEKEKKEPVKTALQKHRCGLLWRPRYPISAEKLAGVAAPIARARFGARMDGSFQSAATPLPYFCSAET